MKPGKSKKSGKRQCGALPWRMGEAGLEILLVTSRGTRRWVIPKGWPLHGASLAESAAAEAFEEAGVEGKIETKALGHYVYDKLAPFSVRRLTVDVFAMAVERELETWPEARQRDRRWFSPRDAARLVDEAELGELIRRFKPH